MTENQYFTEEEDSADDIVGGSIRNYRYITTLLWHGKPSLSAQGDIMRSCHSESPLRISGPADEVEAEL